MMAGLFSALGFAAPMALIALAALPAIWLLLRVTPPRPRRIVFPPLKLFADLTARRETPARTPWWLLLLRLAIAACVILAAAGPTWNPLADVPAGGRGPVLLIIDNGFASARDWRERAALAAERIQAAGRANRQVAVLATADRQAELTPQGAGAALQRLRVVAPAPFAPQRAAHLGAIAAFAGAPGSEIEWITDGVSVASVAGNLEAAATPKDTATPDDGAAFIAGLAQITGTGSAGAGRLTVFRNPAALPLALAGTDNAAGGLDVRVLRAEPNGREHAQARALDIKGLALGEAPVAFDAGATETTARFTLPIELRNAVARIDITDEASAGAVALLDESGQRRRVGLVAGASTDGSQPLLAPAYYVAKALAPFAEVREPRAGPAEAISTLLAEKVSVLVLADVGTLDRETVSRLDAFMDNGGIVVRFSGSRLAAGNDDLVPARLRRGGRSLGGALSWDAPKTLAPFPRESPFFGLGVPDEISVRRQILAEPDGDLAGRTWASLADGTPIVTADRRGKGLVVLFHVTADPSWSNLPLSGVFVDMLRRIVALAGASVGSAASDGAAADGSAAAARPGERAELVAPQRTLDGFGAFRSPPATAKPVARSFAGRASEDHPPGFYGPNEAPKAVNALVAGDRLSPLNLAPLSARIEPIGRPGVVDLRTPLLLLAALLFLIDSAVSLLLGGFRPRGWRKGGAHNATAAALALLGVLLICAAPQPAFAQGLLQVPGPAEATPETRAQSPQRPAVPPTPARPPQAQGGSAAGEASRSGSGATAGTPLSKQALEAAHVTRLAYVLSGDAQVDETSRAGLIGLSQALAQRTALEPGEPAGVDPAKDELAFYPVLYWPIVAGRPQPPEAALRKLDAYMKGGGTVIFDTRDAMSGRPDRNPAAESLYLRRMLSTLDIPELEPLPRDHVLTKAFYLIDNVVGRYATGQAWVEALPSAVEGEQGPARAGDGVSPIIITGNDLASAWAVGRRGEPMYPVVEGQARQREMAIRGGVNIVIYALTGNYKADQVHIPALLERLGQ